jgi:hypothetical protein
MAKLRRLRVVAKRDEMLCRRINRGGGGWKPLSLLKSAEIQEIWENSSPQRLGRIEPADCGSCERMMSRDWAGGRADYRAKAPCEVIAIRSSEPCTNRLEVTSAIGSCNQNMQQSDCRRASIAGRPVAFAHGWPRDLPLVTVGKFAVNLRLPVLKI